MDKAAIKELMYGGLSEMAQNRNFYYKGIGPQFSHWTEEGKKALADYMEIMTYKLLEAEEADLNQRSKQLVLKGLKGENI